MDSKILLVDDDKDLCELLAQYLRTEQFAVDVVYAGEAALRLLNNPHNFSVIVLDIMMPGMSGLELLNELRKTQDTPVLMLTGRGDDIDRIIGLEMGADDYMAKPCNPRELVARLRAILRRAHTQNNLKPNVLNLHGITLDPGKRRATANNRELALTSAEFNALHILMQHAGQTLSKQQLTESVLNRKLEAYDRSIDVHISRIRRKLSQANIGDIITAIRGAGYQMNSEDKS